MTTEKCQSVCLLVYDIIFFSPKNGHRGGRFMPTPSRLTIITMKNQKFFFDFLKLYNDFGKVRIRSFSLGGGVKRTPPTADRIKSFLGNAYNLSMISLSSPICPFSFVGF